MVKNKNLSKNQEQYDDNDINSETEEEPKQQTFKRDIDGLSRKERRKQRDINYTKKTVPKKNGFHKLNNDEILEKLNFNFSRDAEWYKKTNDKINEVKEDLDNKFYTPEKKKEKIDFINKLNNKLKDYRDAINYADKYKKVRFVERRKSERMLVKVKKEIIQIEEKIKNELNLDPNKDILDEKVKLNSAILNREKVISDINYIKFFPRSYKYLSLYSKNDLENEETKKKIEKIRSKIDFQLNKNEKNKKFVERKLINLKGEKDKDNKDINSEKDDNDNIEMEIEKEKDEKVNKIANEDNKEKKKFKSKEKEKEKDSNNINNKEKNKKTKEKNYKKMKQAYDYELDVQNFDPLENDDFFIIE